MRGKQVGIHERLKLDTRFKLLQSFNRALFAQPDNLLPDATVFGHSTPEPFRPRYHGRAANSVGHEAHFLVPVVPCVSQIRCN